MSGTADPRCRRCAGRLLGKLRRTVRRWDMLPSPARVAVAVSGGVDSLALVALLAELRRVAAGDLELIGLHVKLDAAGESAGLPSTITGWCESLGVPLEQVPPRRDPGESTELDCFACARLRRRTLLEAADARGCRVLALGHHADDVVDTWLLALFYSGSAEAMAPVRTYFEGAVRVVRPLYEIRKAELRRMANLCGLPAPPARCPRERDARRERVRAALAALGTDERRVRRQVYWAAVRTVDGSGR